VAQRAVLPSTADEALDAYATAVMNRRQPSEPIETRKATAESELVFPGVGGLPYSGFSTLITRIRARIGEAETTKEERLVFRDIRRSFVSLLAERGGALEAWGGLVAGEGESQNVVALRAAQRL
jgi:integrase